MNYRVSPSSPTDELVTLGQIFSEAGGYMSTIIDREHLSLSRKCATKLNQVVGELTARKHIRSEKNLHETPRTSLAYTSLAGLSIDELYSLYRQWPDRHNDRLANGREHFTFYREGDIVKELRNRKAANKAEQLKIDYCSICYGNELDNMAFVFSRPVKIDGDKIYPDSGRDYSPSELLPLISLHSDYRDITERELLIEYVDKALDSLDRSYCASSVTGSASSTPLPLLSEIAGIGCKKIIAVPEWVGSRLEEAVNEAVKNKSAKDSDLAVAMLTLQMLNDDRSLIRRAKRTINRCYRSAFDVEADTRKRIDEMHTAVTCCDFVSRFSVRKSALVWNDICVLVLSSAMELTPKQIFQLLEIANELENFATVSSEHKNGLKMLLKEKAKSDSIEAITYNKLAERKF